MPRKKRKLEEEHIEPPVATLLERWNVDALESIVELALTPEKEHIVSTVLSEMSRNTYRKVEYRPGEFKDGQIYGIGYQGCPGWIRRICGYLYYHDIDIKNCAPTLFAQILEKKLGECPNMIQRYATDRAGIFNELRRQEPDLATVSNKVFKTVFLASLHGASHTNHFDKLGLSQNHEPISMLSTWEEEIKRASKDLQTHREFKKLWKKVEGREDKKNKLGTFTAWTWQREANNILLELSDFFKMSGRTVGALIFDGLMIERKPEVPSPTRMEEDILRQAEKKVLIETGFKIVLVEKSLVPTEEDYEKYWGPKSLHKIGNAFAKQVYLLRRAGQTASLKRMDGWTVKPHVAIPGVFIRDQEDTTFINSVLKSKHVYRGASLKKLLEWFSGNDHPCFELLTLEKMNRNVVSFQNCYLDLSTQDPLHFVQWHEVKRDQIPITDHYFDMQIDFKNMERPTPLWDSLLATQLGLPGNNGRPSLFDMLEIMIGRLFFVIGKFDNWQLHLFLKGDANTGKSTVLKLIKKMFPVGSVGCVTATQEKTFGLESIYQKRLVLIPDMPTKLSKLINQSDFQSMASGESVSVARKNKVAISDQPWTVPLAMAGNPMPDYKDNSGSVSRRLAMFMFTTLVQEKNTTLEADIITTELVTVMLRCISKYKTLAIDMKGKEFWSHVAPDALKNAQMEVKEQTNYLANFLTNGDEYYQIIHDEGSTTTLEKLSKAFSNHMKFIHKIDRARIGSDYHPIKAAGFMMRTDNLCKVCHQKASRTTCGLHYDPKNRYKKRVICDMKLVHTEKPANQFAPWTAISRH